MSRFRSRWLALFGGATLIALTLSTAFGAKPDAETNRGQQVSAFVHSLVGDLEDPTDEQVDEPTDTETETEDDPDTEVHEGHPSNHGACVSEAAHLLEFGGKNENHGGAVSEAARVTCSEDATSEEPTGEVEADDDDDGEVEADDDDGEVEADDDDDGEVEADDDGEVDDDDSDESDSDHEQGEGRGHGHGDDSSKS